jgi:hypothetical protein
MAALIRLQEPPGAPKPILVDRLWTTLEPEDLWVLATTKEKQYPPNEYDHPHIGPVVLMNDANQETLHRLCPGLLGTMLGCAVVARDGISTVAIADDKIIRAFGMTYRLVLRHEIAHPNHWPPTHPGAR